MQITDLKFAVQIRVGTSGWFYCWNPERTLDWYEANSGLNAVELNASFYRFPFPNQIKSWARKGAALRWAVKVSRLVTHVHQFNAAALEVWHRFADIFAPLDRRIDFYLFQLPPALTPRLRTRIEEFIHQAGLGSRLALEFRNSEWFTSESSRWAQELGITLVSVDAPVSSGLPSAIFCTSGAVYLRLHGRTGWYQHNYTPAELREIAGRIMSAAPDAVYVFFNNDQHMLANARQMLSILKRYARD